MSRARDLSRLATAGASIIPLDLDDEFESGTVGAAVKDFAGGRVSTMDLRFGAVGNGTGVSGVGHDDTLAVQAAFDYAAARGLTVYNPGVVHRLTAPIQAGQGVDVKGVMPRVTVGNMIESLDGGSWFFLDHPGEGFYCRDDLNIGKARPWSLFTGIGTARAHAAPGPGWTPTVYAPDFRIENRVLMDNVVMLNPYIGARVRSAGVLWTSRVFSQALFKGIEVERSSDVQYWRDLSFWPFWSQSADVYAWTLANAVAVRARRADGLNIDNIFSYGYAWTIDAQDVSGDNSGLANYHFSKVYADKAGGAVRIKSDFYAPYGTISDVTVNSDPDVGGSGDGIEITGVVAGRHLITGLAVTRAHESALYVHGTLPDTPAHFVHCLPFKIENWDRAGTGNYAFKADDRAEINLLAIPSFSNSPVNRYNEGTSGTISLPAKYGLANALPSAQGFYSRRVTIADDAVAVIAAPTADKTFNLHIVPATVPAAGAPAGSYWFRCNATPAAVLISATHTANVDVGTGVCTGTTGTDGNLRLNADDGYLYIENRTGVSLTFTVTMLGS